MGALRELEGISGSSPYLCKRTRPKSRARFMTCQAPKYFSASRQQYVAMHDWLLVAGQFQDSSFFTYKTPANTKNEVDQNVARVRCHWKGSHNTSHEWTRKLWKEWKNCSTGPGVAYVPGHPRERVYHKLEKSSRKIDDRGEAKHVVVIDSVSLGGDVEFGYVSMS